MTYWEETGKYQKEYDTLNAMDLVPLMGDAPTYEGQALRYMANMYHDWFNNGLGNDMSEAQMFIRKWAKQNSTDEDLLFAVRNIHTKRSRDEDYELMADAVIKWVYDKLGVSDNSYDI